MRLLAKHQPCGCVVCTCEDDTQCHGCGAHYCGTHPVGQIPNPVYEPDQSSELDILRARVAELEALLRRVDTYFQHTGKVGDLPISVHALLPKLIHRHEDGTETTVTPLPMWQP